MDSLFDDSEPEADDLVSEEISEFDRPTDFRRYVSEGMTLLEEWLRSPS